MAAAPDLAAAVFFVLVSAGLAAFLETVFLAAGFLAGAFFVVRIVLR